MKLQLTGGSVIAIAGLVVVAGGVYWGRKKLTAVADTLGDIVTAPARAVSAINNAVPPGMTFDQVQPDGSIKPVTVEGSKIKQANANPTNMGMVAWPSSGSSSPWYLNLGYTVESWEKENPFGEPPVQKDDEFKWSSVLDYVSPANAIGGFIGRKIGGLFGGES